MSLDSFRRSRRRRFRPQRAVVALTVGLVLSVALSGALLMQRAYRESLDNAQAVLDGQARAAEIATDRSIAAIDAVLLGVAELAARNLRSPASEGLSTDRLSTDRLLRRFPAQALGIEQVSIIGGSGRADAGGADADASRLSPGWSPPTAAGLSIGAPYRNGAHGGGSIILSRRLTRGGKPVGFVAATVRLAALAEPLRAIARDGRERISLLHADGSLIAEALQRPDSIGGKPDFPLSALAALAGHDAAYVDGADGWLRSLRRVADRALIVSASRDRREVLDEWSKKLAIAMLALLLFALAAAALGRLAVRALGRRQLAMARLRRSEARLRRQSTLLQSTLDAIGEGISVFNKRGRLMAWNARFGRLLDFPPEVIAGSTLESLLTFQAERGDFGSAPPAEEVARRLAAFYREVPMVRERAMTGGRVLQIRRDMMPDGGVVSVYSDISEMRASERKLIEARSQAELANRAKSDFLANMSHELRTPLNAIIGFSEMICGEIFGPIENSKYLEYLKDVHASSLHLLSIINDILDMSKIEAGKMEFACDTIVLQPVIAEAIRMVSERARNRNIELASTLPIDPVEITGDERAVKQIMLNLLSNAVKFSLDGGRVDVRLTIDGAGKVVFEAEDRGIGIAEADIDRVLQPFGQTREVTTKAYGGTGLGLPITKGLVAAHGGELVIRSILGRGTLVRIILPRQSSPSTAPGDTAPHASQSVEQVRAVA